MLLTKIWFIISVKCVIAGKIHIPLTHSGEGKIKGKCFVKESLKPLWDAC